MILKVLTISLLLSCVLVVTASTSSKNEKSDLIAALIQELYAKDMDYGMND